MVAARAQQRPLNPAPLLALILMALLAVVAGKVLLSSHAVERHGTDARRTRECIQRNGPMERWVRTDDDGVRYWLCEVEPDSWCVQIVQVWPSIVDGASFRERTAFCVGSYDKIRRYVSQYARLIS